MVTSFGPLVGPDASAGGSASHLTLAGIVINRLGSVVRVRIEGHARFVPSIPVAGIQAKQGADGEALLRLTSIVSVSTESVLRSVELRFRGQCLGELGLEGDASSPTVRVASLASSDDLGAWAVLSDSGLDAVLGLQGMTLLHAAAFQLGEAKVVVLGESGGGKTTVAAAAEVSTGQALADDLLAIRLAPGGKPSALSLDTALRMRKATVTAFRQEEQTIKRLTDAEPRWERWLPQDDVGEKWFEPTQLWITSVNAEREESTLKHLPTSRAVAYLVRGFGSALVDRRLEPLSSRMLEVAGGLLREAPAFEVCLGADLLRDPVRTMNALLRKATDV